MPPFKDQLGPAAARALARELTGAWPEFPARRFMRGVAAALEPLELSARADVLSRAVVSPTFTGWMVWPCGTFVARAGIDEPDAALPPLEALTPRWSSEFAIGPSSNGTGR